MKKSIIVVLLLVFAVIPSFALTVKDLQGLWLLRMNGNRIGYLEIKNYTGVIRIGDSAEDTVHDIKLEEAGSGGYRITFKRRGSVNQAFTGWISSDAKQLAGFYVQDGAEYPWWANK